MPAPFVAVPLAPAPSVSGLAVSEHGLMHQMQKILEDREARWQQRVSLVTRYGLPLGTLTLNIPGNDKHPLGAHACVKRLFLDWCRLLDAAGLPLVYSESHDGADGPAMHLVVQGSAEALKRSAIALESQSPAGRLADADVLDATGSPFGRAQLGLEPRPCLLCNAPALVCMREHRHPIAVLLRQVQCLLCETEGNRSS